MTRRVGIIGGTFDPVHNGHIVAAVSARHQLDFDETLMMVAPDPWQKSGTVVAPAAHRMAMVELACNELTGIVASALEINRSGPTYTIDTVEALRADGNEVVVVLGADAAARVDTWHRADELATMATIAVVGRAGAADVQLAARWKVIHVVMPRVDVSSSELRERVRAGAPIAGLTPAVVDAYIHEHELYR